MTYLLDTMIVSYFLQAEREAELAQAATCCSMALVEEVRQELDNDKDRGGKAFREWLAASNIDVRAIEVGSAAAGTLAQLLNPVMPSKGRGERASIALAGSDPSLTLVSHDKNGLWIALRELWMPGERIVGLPVFVRRLFDVGALTAPDIADEIISLGVDAAQRPSWWASWRAGLAGDGTSGASKS